MWRRRWRDKVGPTSWQRWQSPPRKHARPISLSGAVDGSWSSSSYSCRGGYREYVFRLFGEMNGRRKSTCSVRGRPSVSARCVPASHLFSTQALPRRRPTWRGSGLRPYGSASDGPSRKALERGACIRMPPPFRNEADGPVSRAIRTAPIRDTRTQRQPYLEPSNCSF